MPVPLESQLVSTPALPTLAPELLAPAGDWESLRAAVANGADAVYFGLSNFNARHRATNFTREELPEVMQFLHHRNVRGYVALNTLIFSPELEEAAACITSLAQAGVDAVIVQDLGLARLIHRLAPNLPIHGSTQMTLTEPRGIEFVRSLGVERVILARELSLDEIGQITQRTQVPVEVFVHGALCVAYSGQCLTSEALGGRSANRGQCAQACRLPYDLVVDHALRETDEVKYLLSPQDLAAHHLIEPLMKLGVCSFKIEGRLKSAAYVAITSQAYRAAINAALAGAPFVLPREQQLNLQQSFSRGFSPGFLEGVNHQGLVSGRFPKSRGVRLGTVVGKTGRGLELQLEAAHEPSIIKPGDGVVFDQGHPEQDEQGGRVYEVRAQRGSHTLELVFDRGSVHVAAVELGSIVWKTDDPALRRRLEQSYNRDLAAKREPLRARLAGAVGQPLTLELHTAGGHSATATWPGPLELARKFPLTQESAAEQLGRLGETPFELAGVELALEGSVMVPKSVLNELRREATASLQQLRETAGKQQLFPAALANLRREAAQMRPSVSPFEPAAEPQLYVLTRTLEQLRAVLAWQPPATLRPLALVYCDFEDVRRYADAVAEAHLAGKTLGVATLRIIKPHEEGLLAIIAKAAPDAVLVRNLASLEYFRERLPLAALVGDFSLNVANELTASLFSQAGLVRMVPSYDLNYDQLAHLLQNFAPSQFEVVIHQHMPMFHMEHCVFAHMLSTGKDFRDCGRPCDRHRVELRDRTGAEFPLLADTGCRNTVFNAVAQSAAEFVPRMKGLGVRHFRVELLRETAAEVGPLLNQYARVLAGLDNGRATWRQLQALNQLGVTRGTLQLT